MKSKLKSLSNLGLLTCISSGIASAAVTFSGDSLVNTPGLESGQKGVFLVDENSVGFGSLVNRIQVGLDLSLSSTYSGTWGDFEVLTVNSASSVLGGVALPGSLSAYEYSGNVGTGDEFGFVVFENSSSIIESGDIYDIWTANDWIMPGDSVDESFGTGTGDLTQYREDASPSFTGTAIPEPSAYATIVGLLSLAYVVARRRRRSSSVTTD